MGFKLRVATFNCYGIKTSLSTVYELCDILFLQETLLFPHELSVLSTAHPEFEGMGVSAIDTTERIIVGRPYGGVAILTRKELREYCNFLFYDNPRIMGIEFKSITDCIYFMNVYMPYQCTDNYDCYVEYLGKISAILEECTTIVSLNHPQLSLHGSAHHISPIGVWRRTLNYMLCSYQCLQLVH